MKHKVTNSTNIPSNVISLIIEEHLSKEEEERLILLGEYVEYLLENKLIDQERYDQEMDKFLTKNTDRALFGLPLIPYRP